MSDDLVPLDTSARYTDTQIEAWQEPRPPAPALERSPIERPLAAMRRYKWLIVAIVVLATAGGVVAGKLITPQYEVHASVLVSAESPMESRTGPIRSAELFGSTASGSDDWTQLLRSFVIADAVVRQLSLFVLPNDRTKSTFYEGFGLADRFVPGKYHVVVDKGRKRWTLSFQSGAAAADSGTAADSVGRKFGFLWQVPGGAFAGSGQETFDFTIAIPRDRAVELLSRLVTDRQAQSEFLRLTFQDPDPQLAADVVNHWVAEFVSVAGTLKKRKLVEFSKTLAGQVQAQKATLDAAEIELSSFRVNTITQPSEGPIAAGVQETRDPVMRDFFEKSLAYDAVKQDVQALQSIVSNLAKDSVPQDALLQIPSVASGGAGAEALRQAFTDYRSAETNLALHRIGLTDEHPLVKADLAQLQTLKKEKIPQLAKDLLTNLRRRETDDSVRISAAGANLKRIPQRTIEEERLRRNRDVAATLFANLQNRFAEAQLAEASAATDVRVLDPAVAPRQPQANKSARLLAVAVAGGVGAALVLVILLDKIDDRLRYPEQVTDELMMPIAGTVPLLPRGGVDRDSPEQMFQIIESFRTLRMSVSQATGGKVCVAVSSPSPGDGKSFISANLAMSFADAGFRSVLVDGDTRRGSLHSLFELDSSPGLTDYLAGRTTKLSSVVQATSSENLSIVAAGPRMRRSPELLTSPRLSAMMAQLRADFDVVIFDTPPLAAGVDAYSIASVTGHLLVVLRIGVTRRRMTAEKMRLVERLPINVVGAVLNGVKLEGAYAYYGYIPGYQPAESPGTAMVELT